MNWHLVTLAIASAALLSIHGGAAWACDTCQRFGSSQFHTHAMGGDDFEDALWGPPDPPSIGDDGGATSQFVVQGGKWPQPGGLGSPVTITYSYNNVLDGGLKDHLGVSLPSSLIRGSIEEALGLWASVAPLHFVEVEDEGTYPPSQGAYPNGQFGQIRFSHIYINGPDLPGQLPMGKALAYFPVVGGNLGGDIFFDHGDPWQEVGTLSQPDILGAAIHELGHAIGLGHTNIEAANMYWIFTRFQGLGTGALHPDDIAGVRAVYGAGVGSVTLLGIAIPEPAAGSMLLVIAAALAGSRRRLRGFG